MSPFRLRPVPLRQTANAAHRKLSGASCFLREEFWLRVHNRAALPARTSKRGHPLAVLATAFQQQGGKERYEGNRDAVFTGGATRSAAAAGAATIATTSGGPCAYASASAQSTNGTITCARRDATRTLSSSPQPRAGVAHDLELNRRPRSHAVPARSHSQKAGETAAIDTGDTSLQETARARDIPPRLTSGPRT